MNKPFIVAEMSGNHLGDLDRAEAIICEAKVAGADAIKIQSFEFEEMVVNNKELESLYKQVLTPREWIHDLMHRARIAEIELFSTPFSPRWVRLLDQFKFPRFKIASFELTDTPLIRAVAKTGKPIIMSTGMATEQEIENALKEARRYGPRDITLLKCTSAYPSTAENANLNTMSDMYFRFKTKVGLSDHSPGIGVAVAAAGLGASVIEKHLTLNRADGGPDAEFSMEPDEFRQMVTECRRAYNARGAIHYGPTDGERTDLKRSMYFAKDLKTGHILEDSDIKTARPFAHVSPQNIDSFIGKAIIEDVKYNQPVTWDSINADHNTKQ